MPKLKQFRFHDKRSVSFNVENEVYRRARLRAALEGRAIGDLYRDAFDAYFPVSADKLAAEVYAKFHEKKGTS